MKRYPIGKFILYVPDDHRLIDIHRDCVLYDRSYGLLLKRICQFSPKGVIVDVGANVGDTAAMMATHVGNPLLCVEGGPTYITYFQANLPAFGGQVELVRRFVLTEPFRNQSMTYMGANGTGALTASTNGALNADAFVTVPELLERAKAIAPELALFKSDTDGFDGFIIDEVMQAQSVPLFFECDTIHVPSGTTTPWPGVFRRLSEQNYAVIVFDNFGLPMAATHTGAGELLRDLSGYVHLQHTVHPVRVHYLDVWAFPPAWRETYELCVADLRSDMLKPFQF